MEINLAPQHIAALDTAINAVTDVIARGLLSSDSGSDVLDQLTAKRAELRTGVLAEVSSRVPADVMSALAQNPDLLVQFVQSQLSGTPTQ